MTSISLESDTVECILPTPQELIQEIPLYEEHAAYIERSRATIEAILHGWDPRRLLIVGPCSIHDPHAAIEYGMKLRELAKHVSEQLFVVMRTYFEKPRTIVGWKGMLYDPDLDGSYLMPKGLRQTRELLSELTDLGIPVGCELLEINTSQYYSDYLSWGCVGARTCSSPPHRQLASSLNLPIGFKNSTDGNIDLAIQGILSAATPHVYLGLSPAGQLTRIKGLGNQACHIILRGGVKGPNYHREDVQAAIHRCRQAKVCDRIVIDCSHDNCGKNALKQGEVFQEALNQILDGNSRLVGIMLESHLYGGSQEIAFPLKYGVSITDPCLDWKETERLILNAYHQLKLI